MENNTSTLSEDVRDAHRRDIDVEDASTLIVDYYYDHPSEYQLIGDVIQEFSFLYPIDEWHNTMTSVSVEVALLNAYYREDFSLINKLLSSDIYIPDYIDNEIFRETPHIENEALIRFSLNLKTFGNEICNLCQRNQSLEIKQPLRIPELPKIPERRPLPQPPKVSEQPTVPMIPEQPTVPRILEQPTVPRISERPMIPMIPESLPSKPLEQSIDIEKLKISEERNGYTLNELKDMAIKMGLTTSGRKDVLAKRILAKIMSE